MSTLRVNTLANQGGTQSTAIENAINGSAKAWVNFDGTGTVAIRASYNVSSITDNGTGNYTVNFTNALADANYGTSISNPTGGGGQISNINGTLAGGATLKSTTQLRFGSYSSSFASVDTAELSVAIFR